ncbi:MAG: serine/threonine protein kinase [Polyangiales bacterium]
MTPQTIGRYELLAEIASGGMATVYSARVKGADGFEKLVALKRMLPDISADSEFQKMFLDEGRLAAQIRSSHVVSTFDLDRHEDGSLYLVMDLVIGASLAAILRGSAGAPIPVPVVVQIVQQAACGLNDAHNACSTLGQPLRIVHRDISPQNILVGLDGSTRITDFGVAQAEKRLAKTAARVIKGKLSYCSPEQARAQPLDRRSDIFALGVVLWETLTQRRLFKRAKPHETLTAVLNASIPDPRSLRPEVPPNLAAVVMRALERDVARRFQTASEFAAALAGATKSAGAEEVQAVVNDCAGESIGRMVAAIQYAVRAREARPSISAVSTTLVDVAPGIGRATLATKAIQRIDAGDLLLSTEDTGPLYPPTLADAVNPGSAPAAVASMSAGPCSVRSASPRSKAARGPMPISSGMFDPPPPMGNVPEISRRRRPLLIVGAIVALALAAAFGHLVATAEVESDNVPVDLAEPSTSSALP